MRSEILHASIMIPVVIAAIVFVVAMEHRLYVRLTQLKSQIETSKPNCKE